MPVLCSLADVIANFVYTCGRCYCHHNFVADVIASIYCVTDVIAIDMCYCHCVADVIAKVADGIAFHGGCGLWSDVITMSGRWNSHWVILFYLSFSSGLLHRTSSHIWGRWYLPMYLFRDGLHSFMVLMRFWSSLPIILKLSMVTSWTEMMEWSYIGEGVFWCSLNFSVNVLADSPMYSSSHSTLWHLYMYMTPPFSGYDLYPLEPWGGSWW